MNKLRVFLIFAVALLLIAGSSTPASAAPPLPGAIFTTDSTCTSVNLNIYTDKGAVFISGGPQHHPGAAGLADGSYYVQVTDPSGATVLGSSGSATPVHVTNGVFDSCYQLSSIVNSASSGFLASGYDDTPNAGGEYKVWVSNDPSFQNNSTKTDNFKVNAVPPPQGGISGTKFYDANLNGVQDGGELGIDAWQVTIFGGPEGFIPYTTNTDANGLYQFLNLAPGTYGVCEVIPSASPVWVPTTLNSISPITPDSSGNNFGNVCLGGGGGGLTLGFWSNKNGQLILTGSKTGATIASTYVNLLNGLNLRNGNGSDFVLPGTNNYTTFRTWLLGATATNMAYMLSAQLATMELNVASGGVNGGAIIYAPGTTCGGPLGFASVTCIMNEANTSLGTYGSTPAGSSERAHQEALKNALDKANNDQNFVQATACEVNYSASEPSCAPAQ